MTINKLVHAIFFMIENTRLCICYQRAFELSQLAVKKHLGP